jgi:hypothetical protein
MTGCKFQGFLAYSALWTSADSYAIDSNQFRVRHRMRRATDGFAAATGALVRSI